MTYIEKIKQEIKRRRNAIIDFPVNHTVTLETKCAIRSMTNGLLSFIELLEKEQEVDLEKEIKDCIKAVHCLAIGKEIEKICRHFYELGCRHAAVLYDDIEKERRKRQEEEFELSIIQWTGDNLKEVIAFTGKSPKFGEWFKSWEEYEAYVHSHNNILKLFCEDGSHYEVPVGAWIVKTPDGYNAVSRSKFVPAKEKSKIQTIKGWVVRDKDNSLRIYGNDSAYGQGIYANSLEKTEFGDLCTTDEPIEIELAISRVVKTE